MIEFSSNYNQSNIDPSADLQSSNHCGPVSTCGPENTCGPIKTCNPCVIPNPCNQVANTNEEFFLLLLVVVVVFSLFNN